MSLFIKIRLYKKLTLINKYDIYNVQIPSFIVMIELLIKQKHYIFIFTATKKAPTFEWYIDFYLVAYQYL